MFVFLSFFMIDQLQVEQTYGAPELAPVGNLSRNLHRVGEHVVDKEVATLEDVH